MLENLFSRLLFAIECDIIARKYGKMPKKVQKCPRNCQKL